MVDVLLYLRWGIKRRGQRRWPHPRGPHSTAVWRVRASTAAFEASRLFDNWIGNAPLPKPSSRCCRRGPTWTQRRVQLKVPPGIDVRHAAGATSAGSAVSSGAETPDLGVVHQRQPGPGLSYLLDSRVITSIAELHIICFHRVEADDIKAIATKSASDRCAQASSSPR